MFFEGNRIDAVREMILADDDAGRAKALKKIKVFMKKDFIGIFKSLEGRPATIRLLDPPLHEFIGTMDATQKKDLSNKIGMSAPAITKRIHALHEENPMLGHRVPPRYQLPCGHSNAGRGDPRGCSRGAEEGHQGVPGDHAAARGLCA